MDKYEIRHRFAEVESIRLDKRGKKSEVLGLLGFQRERGKKHRKQEALGEETV